MKRTNISKNTDDGLYGNSQLELKYIGELSDGKFRVAVWSTDDFGIGRDFEKESDAIKMFENLKTFEKINQSDLFDLKFTVF